MSPLNSNFSLLACDHVELDKTWNYSNVTSVFYRLMYITKGSGTIFNSDFSVSLEPGFLYLVPSFTNCNYRCDSFLSQQYICFIENSADGTSMFSGNQRIIKIAATAEDVAVVKRVLSLNPNRGLTASYNPRVFEKSRVLTGFIERNRLTMYHKYIETCGLLLLLISRFLAAPEFMVAVPKPINEFVANALYYIQTNLQSPITVALLARVANKSPDHFSHKFFESTGELPLNYIRIKRIDRARLLLLTTNMSCYEIAAETGFESLSYFTRTFKKAVGQTPSMYRSNTLMLGTELYN